MTELLELPVILKALTYALFCLSSAWLVRAGVFGIVIDSARIAAPGITVLLLHQELPVLWSLAAGLSVWMCLMLAFALAREKYEADDILLSLGLQATIYGIISFLVVETMHQRFLTSLGSPSSLAIASGATAILIVLAIYFLSFSTLRLPLAHAAVARRPSGTYPSGGGPVRVLAILAAGLCSGVAALATMTLGSVSLEQWTDGIGVLLFGIAYALRGRALACALAGASIALVEALSTIMMVRIEPGLLEKLWSNAHLLWGLVIIALSVIRWHRVSTVAA
jgi:ABC-type uncharacterized transport system permease subunit